MTIHKVVFVFQFHTGEQHNSISAGLNKSVKRYTHILHFDFLFLISEYLQIISSRSYLLLHTYSYTILFVLLLVFSIGLQNTVSVAFPTGSISNFYVQVALSTAFGREGVLCNCCQVYWSFLCLPLIVSFPHVLCQIRSVTCKDRYLQSFDRKVLVMSKIYLSYDTNEENSKTYFRVGMDKLMSSKWSLQQ